MNNFLISVVGPTAIGKTELAIEIARHFNTEIISADSRQFYREMSIGTAKPDNIELSAVKHHFINSLSVTETYTAANFEKDALKEIDQIFQSHNVAVLVGGSGMFINALLRGFDDIPEVDSKFRVLLNEQLSEHGIESLQNQLRQLDPDYYAKVDQDNPQRIIRALEVCLSTGAPFSKYLKNTTNDRNFKSIKIGLNTDREKLYDRINMRVDRMIANGLIDEARSLVNRKHLNALQTVGYTELFDYLEGDINLDEAILKIKQNTRRFAKRQLTWFRKDPEITWFDPAETEKIIAFIESSLKPAQ